MPCHRTCSIILFHEIATIENDQESGLLPNSQDFLMIHQVRLMAGLPNPPYEYDKRCARPRKIIASPKTDSWVRAMRLSRPRGDVKRAWTTQETLPGNRYRFLIVNWILAIRDQSHIYHKKSMAIHSNQPNDFSKQSIHLRRDQRSMLRSYSFHPPPWLSNSIIGAP